MLQLQPPLRPCSSLFMRSLSNATCKPVPVLPTPTALLAASWAQSAPPSPAPRCGTTAYHIDDAPRRPWPQPSLRRHTRCFSFSAAASTSPVPGEACADDSISDAEWAEVEARLMEMAASKNRASVSGVRRNEFELMPIFMQRVGLSPDRLATLNFIHVAGTKGKGSTCSMVESILRRCGYRTALYTSPHLVDVRERIRVDGRMLPRSEFAAAFRRVYGRLRAAAEQDGEGGPGMPSFFYFITLMAMDALLCRPPSLAPHVVVLEVGIGGRLDATRAVVTHGSLLAAAAITSLGFDHMELLGDTLPKIAREKAGIMRCGRPVLVAPQEPDAMQTLEEVASHVGAQLVRPAPLERYRLSQAQAQDRAQAPTPGGPSQGNNGEVVGVVGLGGEHMRVNAALAVALAAEWEAQYGAAAAAAAAAAAVTGGATASAVEAAVAAAGRPVALAPGGPDPAAAAARAAAVRSLTLPVEYEAGLRTVRWPGRSQVVLDDVAASRGGRLTFYLDGAHTPESMAVCAAWFAGELTAEAEAQAAVQGTGESKPPPASPATVSERPRLRHAPVLLFNCMRERDPAVLLPALAAAMLPQGQGQGQQQGQGRGQQQEQHQQPGASGAQRGLGQGRGSGQVGDSGVGFDAAIFTPMLSGGGVLLPAHTDGKQAGSPPPQPPPQQQPPPQAPATATASVDLSWQTRMRQVWDSLPAVPPSSGGSAAAAASASAAAGLHASGGGGGGAGGRLYGLQYASVVDSLPAALEAVRAAAAADPWVHVHVLVTGSLYLVGDVLRLLNKPPV